MGIREGAQLRHAQNAAQPHLGDPYSAVSLFYTLSGANYSEGLSGNTLAEHTMQQPGERTSHVKTPGDLYNEFNTCFTYNPAACPWRGTCQILPSLAYRTSCIVLLSRQPFLINNINLLSIIVLIYFYIQICSVMTFCNRTLWCGQYTRGLQHPITWCEKTEHSHECGTPNL